jgi:hypothetical protein
LVTGTGTGLRFFGTEQELECDFFSFLKRIRVFLALFKYGTGTGTKVL